MHRRSKILHLFFWLLFLQPLLTFGYSQAENTSQTAPSPLIIISIDGMRADYIDRFNPPAISKLAKEGVRAKWMIPSFPTKTFPNHYTIVTGLYPAHHGIVENNIYDFGTVFTMGNRQEVRSSRWWGGEPIWVTAEKQGLRAASYFFVGTEAEIGGVKLKLRRDYNGKVPNDLRIDTVLRWLDLPASERPSLILMYFSDVDDVGHEFGPDAEETKYAVWDVDRSIARLVEGLTKRGILDKTNIILVSDHGMAAVNPNSAVFFDDYLDLNDAQQILWTSEIVQIFPKSGNEQKIIEQARKIPHVTCWLKSEIPARFHYNGKRVAPIVCSSEEGWMATTHQRHNAYLRGLDEPDRIRGAHGYDNQLPSMRAIFIATGPAFKQNFVAEPFENVEVYNLMCKILGLTPAPNDGHTGKLDYILRGN